MDKKISLKITVAAVAFFAPATAMAMIQDAPPPEAETATTGQDAPAQPAETQPAVTPAAPVDLLPETPVEPPKPVWSVEVATKLLSLAENIGAEGLRPADYKPMDLARAIAEGESVLLDQEATRVFSWLIEDMRDGRTPSKARVQWFVNDPDIDLMPTQMVMQKALESGDVAAALQSVVPVHADYAALKTALNGTPEAQVTKRKRIMANMDRWRWLPRSLGKNYLKTNVPEYQLRFVVNNQQISTYRTVVGKPGRTATPQLAEMVEGVVFNPTWTVPQSIVKGEGLGARVLGNPGWARTMGYKATRGRNGYVSVVQQPGPRNALGMMKLHMPNAHAIFLHDTPSRRLFRNANRALSHGCIRTERALELAMTMALVLGDISTDRSKQIVKSRKYTLVKVKRQLPVYITYFTMATGVDGKMSSFRDIYGRDKPVFAALNAKRPVRKGKFKSEEKVVAIEAPGA